MHVEQILNTKGSDVITPHANETVAQAAIRMEANSIGALVIVDGDNESIGILSERDFAHGTDRIYPRRRFPC